jgi:hypothetical protein
MYTHFRTYLYALEVRGSLPLNTGLQHLFQKFLTPEVTARSVPLGSRALYIPCFYVDGQQL